jgi:inosine/xanthosine triphosphate pyrophosphatase family protein
VTLPPPRGPLAPPAVRIVVATLNPDKLREIEALLPRDLGEFVGLGEFAGAVAPPEDGNTLEENALAKARAERMTGIETARRAARFRTVCVACFPDRPPIVAEGVLEGRITDAPRGGEGFGYDPVFEVAGTGRTLAELPFDEKNALSHRARAIAALVSRLRGESRQTNSA